MKSSLWLGFVLCLALSLCAAGCKKTPQDAVLAQYVKGEKAIANYDLDGYKSTVLPQSLTDMESELVLAISANEQEMKQLRPSTLMYVLALRNRQAPAYIRKMSPDDYLLWLMEQGFIVVDAENEIYPYEVSILGNTATVQMGEKVEVRSRGRVRFGRRRGAGLIGLAASTLVPRSQLVPIEGYEITYQRVNGVWYSDASSMARAFDEIITQAAREEKMPVHQYLVLLEEEAHGTIKKDIWSPPR